VTIAFTNERDALAHPLDLPAAFGVRSGIKTGPDVPVAPRWMCAAAAAPDKSRAISE
jgi:hypothetical protein